MSNRAFGYLFLALAAAGVPVGYLLVPFARYLASHPMPDGSRAILSPFAGQWPVPTMFFMSLAFFGLALYFFRKARKSKDDSSKGI